MTEFAGEGQRLSENAKDFDGKMCDVGQHHRLRPSGLRLSYSPSARRERWRAPERRRLRPCPVRKADESRDTTGRSRFSSPSASARRSKRVPPQKGRGGSQAVSLPWSI